MKLDRKIKKLIEVHTLNNVVTGLLTACDLEKLILSICNQCIFKANSNKIKKKQRIFYKLARLFHRGYDEMVMERTKKTVFKISRKDVYKCPSCKKIFRVEPAKEQNCKFDLSRGMIVVTCPNCKLAE